MVRRSYGSSAIAASFASVSAGAKKFLEEALSLSGTDRADIAASLIKSLDVAEEEAADEAWAAEIERRCAELDRGEAVTSDWAAVRRRIESRLSKP